MSGVVASAAPLVAPTLIVPVARLIARMMAFTVVVIMIVVVLTLHTGFLRGRAFLLGLLARKLPQRAHVVLALDLVAAGRSKSCR